MNFSSNKSVIIIHNNSQLAGVGLCGTGPFLTHKCHKDLKLLKNLKNLKTLKALKNLKALIKNLIFQWRIPIRLIAEK